ncbi:MAG: 3'-5' exonuclease [Cetobacterium sp.]
MKLLFIDTETGGINEKENSLLSVALICWEDKKVIDKLEIFIEEESYNVTERAMEINGLNLENVKKYGLEKKIVIEKINSFILKNFEDEKAVLCGHNVGFDIRFLKELYNKVEKNYEEFISYRSLDTASVFRFLTIAGKFKEEKINSLDDAIKYFNISLENRHTAMGDIEKTVQIFNRLVEII